MANGCSFCCSVDISRIFGSCLQGGQVLLDAGQILQIFFEISDLTCDKVMQVKCAKNWPNVAGRVVCFSCLNMVESFGRNKSTANCKRQNGWDLNVWNFDVWNPCAWIETPNQDKPGLGALETTSICFFGWFPCLNDSDAGNANFFQFSTRWERGIAIPIPITLW